MPKAVFGWSRDLPPPATLGTRVRALLIALLLVATAACGAYRFPGAGTPVAGTGTVSGQVSAVPCFPIEPAPAQPGVVQPGVVQPPCAGRPVPGAVIEF